MTKLQQLWYRREWLGILEYLLVSLGVGALAVMGVGSIVALLVTLVMVTFQNLTSFLVALSIVFVLTTVGTALREWAKDW